MDEKAGDTAIEAAKASGKALENITEFFNRLAGPLATEVGEILADRTKVYRAKNWISCQEKIKQMLDEAHEVPQEIPARQFLPMLESASLEDDETLQEMWAALIASASLADVGTPSVYITLLKDLSPVEAQTLNSLFRDVRTNVTGSPTSLLPPLDAPGISCETVDHREHWFSFEAVRTVVFTHAASVPVEKSRYVRQIVRQFEVNPRLIISNLLRLGILEGFEVDDWALLTPVDDERFRYCFTPLGWEFVNTCQGPSHYWDYPLR
jgi:hypothetical protein